MKQAFVTGTSRGLGHAIAMQLLKEEWKVIGIGRTHTIEHPNYTGVTADLSQAGVAEQVDLHFDEHADQYLLVNNAASIYDIAYFGSIPTSTFIEGYQLNLISPAVLMNRFVALTESDKSKERTILNVSSGAAVDPYDGWGMYNSSKAGLDSLTSTLISELEARNDHRSFIYSIAPGVINTEMQAHIREADEKSFSELKRFQDMHKKHHLAKPELVARKLISFLYSNNVMRSGRYDVREFILT